MGDGHPSGSGIRPGCVRTLLYTSGDGRASGPGPRLGGPESADDRKNVVRRTRQRGSRSHEGRSWCSQQDARKKFCHAKLTPGTPRHATVRQDPIPPPVARHQSGGRSRRPISIACQLDTNESPSSHLPAGGLANESDVRYAKNRARKRSTAFSYQPHISFPNPKKLRRPIDESNQKT